MSWKAVRGCPCVCPAFPKVDFAWRHTWCFFIGTSGDQRYFKEGTAQRFVTQYRIDSDSAQRVSVSVFCLALVGSDTFWTEDKSLEYLILVNPKVLAKGICGNLRNLHGESKLWKRILFRYFCQFGSFPWNRYRSQESPRSPAPLRRSKTSTHCLKMVRTKLRIQKCLRFSFELRNKRIISFIWMAERFHIKELLSPRSGEIARITGRVG